MTDQGTGSREARRGRLGGFSRWYQRTVNTHTTKKIRRGRARLMGMDMLILHTVGHRSGQPRETPLAWFADGDDRLVVASGGGRRQPDWHRNLVANPGRVAVETAGGDAVPVTPRELQGAEREAAWRRVTAVQPRYDKYQRKSGREYPVVRLTAH